MDQYSKVKNWLAFFFTMTVMLFVVIALLLWMLFSGAWGDKSYSGENISVKQMKDMSVGINDIYTPTPDPLVDKLYLPEMENRVAWKTKVLLSTNSSGLRFPRNLDEKSDDVFRIVILGDSFVAAHAAPFEHGVSPQLEGILNRAMINEGKPIKKVEVIPIAVSGWNVFSQLAYLTHNLHRVQPDVVIHMLNHNDLDSGYGFVNGNIESTTYDIQGLFGVSHMSIASPSHALRMRTSAKSLVGSGLIPESKKRFRSAREMINRLKGLVQNNYGGQYVICLIGTQLAYGVKNNLGDLSDDINIIITPKGMAKHNLLPLDGHLNEVGHRHLAIALAKYISDAKLLSINVGAISEEGSYKPYRKLTDEISTEKLVRNFYMVDKIPAAINFNQGKIASKVAERTIVGGLYYGGMLSPRTALVLRKQKNEDVLDIEILFPPIPSLQGGKLTIIINGLVRETIDMEGKQSANLILDQLVDNSDLVEIVLESDAYYTEPYMHLVDGVYGGAPRAGRLIKASLVSSSVH